MRKGRFPRKGLRAWVSVFLAAVTLLLSMPQQAYGDSSFSSPEEWMSYAKNPNYHALQNYLTQEGYKATKYRKLEIVAKGYGYVGSKYDRAILYSRSGFDFAVIYNKRRNYFRFLLFQDDGSLVAVRCKGEIKGRTSPRQTYFWPAGVNAKLRTKFKINKLKSAYDLNFIDPRNRNSVNIRLRKQVNAALEEEARNGFENLFVMLDLMLNDQLGMDLYDLGFDNLEF